MLWCRISLASSYNNVSVGTVELVDLWLQRSRNCPLDVDLRLPFDVLPWSIATNDKEHKAIQEILSLLCKHSSRLRTLLRGYPEILHRVLQAEHLPLLELFIVDPPEGDLCIFSIDTLPNNLKSFATFNTYAHFAPTTVWPKLEHLELWQTDAGFSGLSARDCLDILSQLPSLRATGFHVSVDDGQRRNETASKVVLPSLRCLVISTFPEHDISLLLSNLSTPSLEAIGLDGCDNGALADNLPNFFRQCSRTLRLAVLGQVGTIDVTLLGALTCAPSRSRISICASSFDGHVATRVGRTRMNQRSISHEDRWTSVGSPGHLLSLAYTSEDMWSNLSALDTTFLFPYWTYRDLEQWMPAAIRAGESPSEDTGPESIKVSICKGQSVSHRCFSEAWLS
ncbi:hypothetical protein ACEPAG_6864 [Sanghuangporus baumii]